MKTEPSSIETFKHSKLIKHYGILGTLKYAVSIDSITPIHLQYKDITLCNNILGVMLKQQPYGRKESMMHTEQQFNTNWFEIC